MLERRPALGKGLSALIPDAPEARQGPTEIDIDLLSPNAQQPRLTMDDAKLQELAASIRTHGIIQPILVRRVGNAYRIIAGERRWRAAQRAGLHKVPVVVRAADTSERELLEIATIENVQRENLNPIDEARAYGRLADEFGLTQEEIAAVVGKERSSVANSIRLLKLADEVREQLIAGHLSAGHARALLALPDHAAQRQAARDVIARRLSVRETEALVKRVGLQGPVVSPKRAALSDVHTRAAEDKMHFALGAKVAIRRRGHGGTVEIQFTSENELNRIFDAITTRS
jgi:ParB family transcriptional regulator, chromosome partitioning protein